MEPTLMVPPPKFKGHKREHERPLRLQTVADKMRKMPELIAEYRVMRAERKRKVKAANRWK